MVQIIDNGQAHTVIVKNATSVATTRNVPTLTTVLSPGPQGPPGTPGLDAGGTIPAVTFQFGDASPATIATTPNDATREMVLVSFQVEQAFDGVGASVSLGISGQPELLMPTVTDLLSVVGVYEFAPRVELPASTPIILTINPGSGASSGRGQFVMNTSSTT